MAKSLIVVAETEHGELTLPTLECVEEGREVADSLGISVHVLLPGYGVAHLAEQLGAHGADRVIVIEHEALEQFSADGWLAAIAPVLQETDPVLALAPDTGYGSAWIPRLSARWRVPLVTQCIRVKVIAGGYPEMIRVTHDGKRHERLVWPFATMVGVMMVPGIRGVGMPRRNLQAEIVEVKPTLNPASFRDRTLRTLPPDPHTVDLTEAERIVSGGLGVAGPEGLEQLQRLADHVGAALGGTRVVADRGWLPPDRFIGTTGKIVAPKLYMAFGVSGAGQHVAGITGSDTIVAVNTDRTSPLLKMADLGVVGDLHQIVPALIKKLEQAGRQADKAAAVPRETSDLKMQASSR